MHRFIPTCVGNTISSAEKRMPRPVHPHMRGEYQKRAKIKNSVDGSSPHAWGILALRLNGVTRGRFIPTCVGNTTISSVSLKQTAVHPHMRGEYFHNVRRG